MPGGALIAGGRYAGAALRTADAPAVGTLSMLDVRPRSGLSSDEAELLRDLAALVMALVEARLWAGLHPGSGLPNRLRFLQDIDACIKGLAHEPPDTAILMIDVATPDQHANLAHAPGGRAAVPQIVPALPLTVRDYLRVRAPTLQDDEAADTAGPEVQLVLPGHCRAAIPPYRRVCRAVLLLNGDGVAGSPEWGPRILPYLDSIRGSTTVVWAPHLTAHIQTCLQIVVLDRENVLGVGQTAQPAATQWQGRRWQLRRLKRTDHVRAGITDFMSPSRASNSARKHACGCRFKSLL